jgi:hypothetical protein
MFSSSTVDAAAWVPLDRRSENQALYAGARRARLHFRGLTAGFPNL